MIVQGLQQNHTHLQKKRYASSKIFKMFKYFFYSKSLNMRAFAWHLPFSHSFWKTITLHLIIKRVSLKCKKCFELDNAWNDLPRSLLFLTWKCQYCRWCSISSLIMLKCSFYMEHKWVLANVCMTCGKLWTICIYLLIFQKRGPSMVKSPINHFMAS
jgi:hypothetical protein